jgi:tetratricopeptide (TPR) repeat protein
LTPDEARHVQKAWNDVLQGDSASASREFSKVLARRPGLAPAATGLAYARLRAGRFAEAGQGFAAVIEKRADYLPALVGAGSAAFRRGDVEEALSFYRRAQVVAPEDAAVRRRLGRIKLQVTERRVAAAQAALQSGDTPKAIDEYRRALDTAPEVAGLRLELAGLLVESGDPRGASALLEADAREDRQVMLRLGEVLIGLQEYPRALDVYRRLLARDPQDADAIRRSREAREASELLRMPEEYQRIAASPRISRADLAALLAVKVTALTRVKEREAKVAIDISGSWAREHIATVLALDILDLYPNHTFQPGATVRRGDLAPRGRAGPGGHGPHEPLLRSGEPGGGGGPHGSGPHRGFRALATPHGPRGHRRGRGAGAPRRPLTRGPRSSESPSPRHSGMLSSRHRHHQRRGPWTSVSSSGPSRSSRS